MCIRYQISVNPELMWPSRAFGWEYLHGLRDGDDVFPGKAAPIVFVDNDLRAVRAQWGLIPPWAKDAGFGRKNAYNARGESLADKPTFRSAFRQRRCVVPAQAFCERDETRWVSFTGSSPLLMAGLYEVPNVHCDWPSFTIVTTESNELVARYNDRMPVLLAPQDAADWLDPVADPDQLRALLMPFPSDWVTESDLGPLAVKARPSDPAGSLFDDL